MRCAPAGQTTARSRPRTGARRGQAPQPRPQRRRHRRHLLAHGVGARARTRRRASSTLATAPSRSHGAFVYYELNHGPRAGRSCRPRSSTMLRVRARCSGCCSTCAVFRPLAGAGRGQDHGDGRLARRAPGARRASSREDDQRVRLGHPDRPGHEPRDLTPPGIGRRRRSTGTSWAASRSTPTSSSCSSPRRLCAVALWLLMRRTPPGPADAGGRRPRRARPSCGASTTRRDVAPRVGRSAACSPALAGVVGAPIIGSLAPGRYTSVMFVACAAAVLGGLRSIPLAFAGGLRRRHHRRTWCRATPTSPTTSRACSRTPCRSCCCSAGCCVLGRDKSRRAGAVGGRRPAARPPAPTSRVARRLPWALGTRVPAARVSSCGPTRSGSATSPRAWRSASIFMSFVIVTGMGGMVSLAQATFVTAAGLAAGVRR